MKVLEGVLRESGQYYRDLKKRIESRLKLLPRGGIKRRRLGKHVYVYLQYRRNSQVVHKYVGKSVPAKLEREIEERSKLIKQLKEVKRSLAYLDRIFKRHDRSHS